MAYYPRPIEFGAHYKLTSPETGVTATFNNPFDPNYVGMLTEVTGLDSPDIRESAEDLVESDGGVHGRFYYGRRPITMNGRIFGHVSNTERAYRSDLARRASQCLRQDGQLSWVPSQRIDNAVLNPRFANNTSGWTFSTSAGSTTTPTRVTGQNAPGDPATTTAVELNFVASASGHSHSLYANPVAINLPDGGTQFSPGGNVDSYSNQYVNVQYTAQVASISSGPAPTLRLYVRSYDVNNVMITTTQVSAASMSVGVGGWVTISGSLPVSALPAGTARVSIQANISATAAATYVVRVTNLMISARYDNKVPPYIDGSKTGGYWHAVPEGGPSGDYIPMGCSVRRQQPYRESGPWVKDFQIQLVSEDPYILSPYMRTTTISMGSSGTVSNQGNALFYPMLMMYAEWNSGAHIDANGGSLVWLGDMTAGVSPGDLIGTVDTLKHFAVSLNGAVTQLPQYIDWGQTLIWPSIAPGGGTWTFTNGAGAATGAKVDVTERDAWV